AATREAPPPAPLQAPRPPASPRHAPAPAAVGLAGRAHAREPGSQLLVHRELVEEAALEPAAVAQEPAVGQRHVLGLGHADRDRLELPEVARAAELPPAGADALLGPCDSPAAHLSHSPPRP